MVSITYTSIVCEPGFKGLCGVSDSIFIAGSRASSRSVKTDVSFFRGME